MHKNIVTKISLFSLAAIVACATYAFFNSTDTSQAEARTAPWFQLAAFMSPKKAPIKSYPPSSSHEEQMQTMYVSQGGSYALRVNSYDAAGTVYISQEPAAELKVSQKYAAGTSIISVNGSVPLEQNFLLIDASAQHAQEVRIESIIPTFAPLPHGDQLVRLNTPLSFDISGGATLKPYIAKLSKDGAQKNLIRLGDFKAGEYIRLSHILVWDSQYNTSGKIVFGPSYSYDSNYYLIRSKSASDWNILIDDGARFDFYGVGDPASYNDADMEVYLSGSVTPTVNHPPVITGISGPTEIASGMQGVWSIDARDPEGGALSYSVDWGDEYMRAARDPMNRPVAGMQTASFSHTYQEAGTFTITMRVTDQQGLSETATMSVRVDGPRLLYPIDLRRP